MRVRLTTYGNTGLRIVVAALVVALTALAGCDWFDAPTEAGQIGDNLPPETVVTGCPASRDLNVGDDALFTWSGSDSDGYVVAYEWSYDDTLWTWTVEDSVVIEDVVAGEHTFSVRSIDDRGYPDATPAVCHFSVWEAGSLVDRAVLVELITGRFCTYCPNAEAALETMLEEFGRANLTAIAYHTSDGLATSETESRILWYRDNHPEVPADGKPIAIFDGSGVVAGAASVGEAESDYRSQISERVEEGSPVSLQLSGSIGTRDGDVSVKVKVHSPLIGGPFMLRVVAIEDDVSYAARQYYSVARRLLDDEELAVSAVGDSVVIGMGFSVEPGWVPGSMDVIAFIQDDDTLDVLQSGRLRLYR